MSPALAFSPLARDYAWRLAQPAIDALAADSPTALLETAMPFAAALNRVPAAFLYAAEPPTRTSVCYSCRSQRKSPSPSAMPGCSSTW